MSGFDVMTARHYYGKLREELCPRPSCEAFFVSTAGTRLLASCVHRVFARLVSTVALKPCSPRCRPRPHDLRHSFAVRTLLDWYSANAEVQARLPSLSTYMGHIRLAAVHSFFHYWRCHPEHAANIQRVLAIPPKRAERRAVAFLAPEEVDALLDSPDRATWVGRRDHALLVTAMQTGLRVSELLALTRADVHLGSGPHVRAIGKGRKERVAPLTRQTVAVLGLNVHDRALARAAAPRRKRPCASARSSRGMEHRVSRLRRRAGSGGLVKTQRRMLKRRPAVVGPGRESGRR
jgi:site-specific recombinase XerD